MTAIVGVLNKHAAAIAADSAATLGGGKKVMNTANKLFALSKYHPVAIAIYGNADLVETPWEIIIKEYRRNLNDSCFPKVEDYAKNFFDYLKGKSYFCTPQEAGDSLRVSIIRFFKNFVTNELPPVMSPDDKASKIKELLNLFKKEMAAMPYLEGFDVSDRKEVKPYVEEACNCLQNKFDALGFDIHINDYIDVIISYFLKTIPKGGTSGLVFIGYGKDEMFPSVCDYVVGNVMANKIAMSLRDITCISKNMSSSIHPFAQTDVMTTILDGVSPQIERIQQQCFEEAVTKVMSKVADLIEPSHKGISQSIREVDVNIFREVYNSLFYKMQRQEYTAPFVRSVAGLEKEDLADFAESLIKLTSLKRKVSPSMETVGGPVDVMLISKGDGIIWKSRKHYFDKELNHHFFQNYFKS